MIPLFRLPGATGRSGAARRRPLTRPSDGPILNHMVQYSRRLDRTFAALADPTRRGIVERLGRGDASITELAMAFGMTLTGMKKHVRVLEEAGLVRTRKEGRVRMCTLGSHGMGAEAAWIEGYRQMLTARLDRLGEFLERTKEEA